MMVNRPASVRAVWLALSRLKSTVPLLLLLTLATSCRDEEATRLSQRQRMEEEIRERVAADVERRVTAERLRTWRIAGFCALGAGAVGGLVWLQTQRPRTSLLRPALGREAARVLLPGPTVSGTVPSAAEPLSRPWTPPPGRVIDLRHLRRPERSDEGHGRGNRQRYQTLPPRQDPSGRFQPSDHPYRHERTDRR
ncbi:MAG: hypothetical protein MUF04_15135 [Akkermansiaceae bacterium]|nr:hypothetical protein [Akkermansiaceae bacterium]